LAYWKTRTVETSTVGLLRITLFDIFGTHHDFVFAGSGGIHGFMKTFLIRSLIFFLTAAAITVGVFFFVSGLGAPSPVTEEGVKNSAENMSAVAEEKAEEATQKLKEQIPEGGVPLASLPLTESHKKALSAVNINVETFVLTETMIDCAGGKIGADRMTEIIAGNAPSVLEVTKLIPCLGA
jgi:hypothetical protein